MTTSAPPSPAASSDSRARALVLQGFRLVARARRARAFHPRGATYSGWLEIAGDGPLPTGRTDCSIRLSKGVGLPRLVPDFLGVAFRVPVAGGDVDVLATTCLGDHGWRRLTLWPAARWDGARFSTLMPWRSPDGTTVQVLLAVDDPRLTSPDGSDIGRHLPVRIDLRVASTDRDLQNGALVVEAPAADLVAFDPVVNVPPGWRVAPEWLAKVRASAYVGSRAGRPGVRQPVSPGPDR